MYVITLIALSMQSANTISGITTDDYFSLSYVSSCSVSPSGIFSAWTEGRWDEDIDKRNTDIWITKTAETDSVPLRLTFDEAYDGSLQWGANDEWLYFSSRRGNKGDDLPRNGKKQIWRIKPNGSQLMAVTRMAGGVDDWVLKDNGKTICYKIEDETQRDDGWKTLRKNHEDVEYGHGIVDYSELWELNLQTWKHTKVWDEDRVIQYFSPSPSGNKIATITTPDNRLITNEGWSEIGIYDVETGETELLDDSLWRAEAPSPYGWVEYPKWSTDGSRLVFSVDFDGYPREMYVATFEKETPVLQTVGREDEVTLGTSPIWVPDSYDLLYIAEHRTNRPLLQVSNVGNGQQGETKEVITNNLICWDYSISRDSKEIIALVGTAGTLTSVVLATSDPNCVIVIANPNQHIASWQLPSVKVVQWESPDGTTVEGVLELPFGYTSKDGKLPLYVHLHGGPTSAVSQNLEISMYGRGILSSNGWAVLSPNYRGSTGYGDKFLTDLIGRENDIEVQDILAGVDAMVDSGLIDPNRLAVGGWSNGGYLTNCIISTTDRFKAASSGAGVFDQTMQWAIEDTPGHVVNYAQGYPWTAEKELREMSPIFKADNITTPTIIHVGEGDERVPAEQSKALYRALHDYLEVPTQLIIYPGTGHGLSKMSHRKAKIEWDNAWLQKWVLD
ncbi:MAG: S9 family peptidase [Phycisphaerales bacterium]|nr:S9 family peptidase [Planctomycetota bacterium]MBL6996962.1 S9 family peptidase [Phycisphaerales bacterium]